MRRPLHALGVLLLAAAPAAAGPASAPAKLATPAKPAAAKPAAAVAKPATPATRPAPTATAAKPGTPSPQVPLTSWDLDNGLHVLFVPVHTSPVVAVEVWYHAGSKDEPPHRNGMAHMFEHMMFKGSDHVRPEEHARMIDAVGGKENAFTTEDTTTYYDLVPKAYMGFALQLEAERMRHLKLTQATIDSERQVVEEELRQNHLDNPITRLLEAFFKVAYTVHPYHETAIGEKADLDQVTPADCQKFYDTYYQPSNATVVVVGDAEEAEVRKAIGDAFAKYPRAPEPPRPSEAPGAQEPPQTQYREVAESWPSQLGIVIGGYHVPAAANGDTYALQVLSTALSDGEESLLNQRLVRKDKVAVQAGGWDYDREDPSLMMLYGVFLDPSKGDAVKKDLIAAIDQVRQRGLPGDALARAKNQLAAQHTYSLEDALGIANALGRYQYVYHDARAFLDAPARYQAVTNADIQRVAQKYLTQSNLTVAVLPPGSGAPASAPAAATGKGGGK